jgi:CRISPR system Cascade subunit CasE
MILNPKCPQVRRDLGNPQELHRTISNGFEKVGDDEFIIQKVSKKNGEEIEVKIKATPRNKFDILYRLEIERRILFVQSTVKPEWKDLPPDFLLEFEQKIIHEQYGRIENGMNLMFRLQANPSKRDKTKFDAEKPKQRKRFALFRDEDRIADIEVSPTQMITSAASVKEDTLTFRRKKDSPKIEIGAVVFEGVLQVTDAVKFRETLQKGIGSGKAYGFGLMSVAKSPN